MMRESRRRSPQAESSRRRRRERERERDRDRDPNRRSSRDQPTTTTAPTADTPDYSRKNGTSDSYSRGINTEDRDRSAPFAADTASASKPWMGENPNYYTAEPEPIPHSSQPPQPRSRARAHARAPSSSGSDSSSPSYLDISRRYDTSRFGGVLNAFFRAPSEHRRQQRRVKNKAKKRAVFPFSNSSSSSLNSDLAYGDGFIPQSKSSSRRSRSDVRQRNESGDPFQPGRLQRRQTDEEIVAIGRQLSDLAKRQNDEDLRAAGRSRPSKIMSAAAGLATLNEVRRSKKDGIRGIGSSKPAGRYSDDEDWESATDDDSSDDDASALAYGASKTNLPGVLGGAAAAAAGAGALWASQSGRRASEQQRQGVDPSLFGPVNSLNGMVTPVPFRDEDRYNGSGYDRSRDAPSAVTDSVANIPMRQVYPVPTSQPDQFDARHSASLPGSRTDDLPKVSRPGPAPIQAPVPIAPVSSKVYDAQSLEEAGRREDRERRRARDEESRGMSSAAKMTFGTAATAAVAAAALKSHHQRGRDEDYRSYAKVTPKKLQRGERSDHERRRSERDLDLSRDADREARRERERERDRDKDRDRDREHRKSKASISKSKDDREYRRASRNDDYDDRTSKRSETGKDRDRRSYKRDGEEIKVEYDDGKDSRRSRREEKMPADRDLTKDIATGAIVAGGAALAAGALVSGSSTQAPERPLTPAVFTIDREPSFDDWPPRSPSPDVRLSRKDSFEIEKMAEDGTRGDPRSGHEYEDTRREAKSVYDEAKQATVPVGAAAVAAAVAAEKNRGRERQRDEYSDDGSRERSAPAKDAVQEEADRYYREAQAARKIAEEEARSRSRSKGRDRGSKEDEEPEIAIVTPPGYEEDKKLEKSPYDAPNADVRIDNEIFPADTHRFRSSERDLHAPIFKSRDPSAERERPLLNLVMPTPIPSREPTPAPSTVSRSDASEASHQNEKSSKKDKKDKDKKKDKKKGKKSKDRDQQSDAPEPGVDVVIGPKGDIIQTPSTPKSVTWGENETKSYEVESPERERKDSSDKERPRLNKASKWGILAAAIAGSSTEPANEPEPVASDKSASRGISEQGDRSLDDVGDPPIPGPKPGSTESKHMPGSFADDVEFAGTLAAGLEDAGFDPNIVVNDPTYRRRDSPPGSDELHESGFYKKGFSDTVEDLSKVGEPMTPGSGFVIGETETPKDEGTDEWAEVPAKLTKKEKRKQEKLSAAKRQSIDFEDTTTAQPTETQTTEEFTDIPLSKKEQKKRAKAAKAKALAGDDDWETPGQGTETPTSQTHGTETPPSWEAGEEEWEASSSKKKKGKNRKSKDFSELDDNKVSVPVDAFNDIQAPRDINPEDEWDAPKKKKKSKSSSADSPSHSAPASEVGSEGGSKKKSKRRSLPGDDFNDWDGDPPDRKRVDPFEERDVSSVVSEPRYDDRRRDSKSKRSSRYDDDDDTKSIASAPGGSRKSKDSEKRSSGIFSSIFSKSNGHKDDDKKDSFLDNAGTLGAGVGLAGAAAAIAGAASSRQHATEASSEIEQPTTEGSGPTREIEEAFDPEIAPRVIKPAIDPQYGDLLPLPPSEPGSPKETPAELPELPDSRPDTPPEERNLREQERMAHVRRRSAQELPIKSPSRTAIPIQLRLGPRSNPSTPGFLKSSPLNSPGTPDSAGPSKRSARPTSWDSSRGPIPLQLPRHVRHGSTGAATQETEIPALNALRDLPEVAAGFTGAVAEDVPVSRDQSLRLDISEAQPMREFAGSQETTPKAEIRPEFPVVDADSSAVVAEKEPGENVSQKESTEAFEGETEPEPIDPMSKNRSSYLLNSTPSSIRSDRSIDPESLPSPSQQSTPSKQRMLGADLSDIPEDLTSADEHFSDAREGQSEDDFFEEARSALSSELSGGSPTNTTPTRATFAETIPAESDKTTVESDQEWGTAGSKKKGKKGKKKAAKATAAASTWDTPEDESMMSTPLAGPSTADKALDSEADIPSVSVSAPDLPKGNAPPSDSMGQTPLGDGEAQERTLSSADALADEPQIALAPSKKDKRKKKKDKKKQSADTFLAGTETQEGQDTAQPPSLEQTVLEPQGTDIDVSHKEAHSKTDTYFPSAAGLHVTKDTAGSPVQDTDNSSYFPSAARVLPVAVPAAVAAGLALKDHWDNKSSDPHEAFDQDVSRERAMDLGEDEEPMALTRDVQVDDSSTEETKDRAPVETHMSEPLFSQGGETTQDSEDRDASLVSTQVNEDDLVLEQDSPILAEAPAEDEWSSLISTKKSKKNKKKRGALAAFAALEDEPKGLDKSLDHQEPSVPTEEPLAISGESDHTPGEVPLEAEAFTVIATEAGDGDWATSTTSTKKSKNKKKQAATFSAWDEEQFQEAPVVEDTPITTEDSTALSGTVQPSDEVEQVPDKPTSGLAQDLGASLENPSTSKNPVEAEDEWALPTTSKKKGKKNKKKGAALFDSWDEEAKPQDPPSQVRELGDLTETVDIPPSDAVALATPSPQPLAETFEPETTTEPKPENESQEMQAEDEWALPKSAKAKKKDKKKNRQALDFIGESGQTDAAIEPTVQSALEVISEQPSGEEPVGQDVILPADVLETQESAPISLPSQEPETSLPNAEPEDESVQNPGSGEPAETEADEWASISKKDKKKKKNKKLAAAAWDEELGTPIDDPLMPLQEPLADAPAPTVEPDTEFEVPKKGKKGKKNKGLASSSWDEEPTPASEDTPLEVSSDLLNVTKESTPNTPANLEPEFEAPKKKKKGKKGKTVSTLDDWADETPDQATPIPDPEVSVEKSEATTTPAEDLGGVKSPIDREATQDPTEDLRLLTSTLHESGTAEDALAGNDLETPASGALFAVNDLASPLKPSDFGVSFGSLEESAGPAVENAERPLLSGDPPRDAELTNESPDQLEQTPQEADESEFLFPMKKKGKKSKKGKTDPESDVLAATAPVVAEIEQATTDAVEDVANEAEQQDQPEQAERPDPSTTEPNDESGFGFVVKPSKKEKKKKKKGKILAFEEPAADESATPSPEDPSEAELKPSGLADAQLPETDPARPVPEVQEAIAPAPPADEPEAQPEDEWDIPATSKKDNKKKKKLAALAWADDEPSQVDPARSVPETTPVELNSPVADDWASPALSKKDKKKKKKQAALDWTQDDSPQDADPIVPTPTTEAGRTLEMAETPATLESTLLEAKATTVAPWAAAEDEWATPVQSTNDQEKKKKESELDWHQEEKPQDDSPPASGLGNTLDVSSPAQLENPAEDEWAMPTLSKKDKKKKKKQAQLDWMEEPSSAKEPEPAADLPVPINETTAEDAWSVPELSKKDKKKKKKAAALSWADDEAPEGAAASMSEQVMDEKPIQEATSTDDQPATSDSKDVTLDSLQPDATKTLPETTGFPSASVDDPEPEYGFSLSKKDKKNKKKKAKAAALAWPDEEPGQTTEETSKLAEAPSTEQHAPQFDHYDSGAYDKPAQWKAAGDEWTRGSSWEEQEPPREEDEDSWDVTAPKSKKKPRKASDHEDVSENIVAPESRRASEAIIAAPVETLASIPGAAEDDDDEWAALVTGSKSKTIDDPEDFPWSQSRGLGFDKSSEPVSSGPGNAAAADIVPEDITTVGDLRKILSGAGSEPQGPDSGIGSEGLTASKEVPDLDNSKSGTDDVVDKETKAPRAADFVLDDAEPHGNQVGSAAVTEMETSVQQPEPDDSWLAPTKLSKKDKKKKKKQQAMSWDESPETPPAAPDDQAVDSPPLNVTDPDKAHLSEEHGQLPAETKDSEVPIPEPEASFDDWAPKKVSKKDKKKAEKIARLATIESEESNPVATEPAQGFDAMKANETVPEETVTSAPGAEPEVDDWAPKKLSKKDKKKAEKAARLATLEPAETMPDTDEPALALEAELAAEEAAEGRVDSLKQADPGFDDWAPKKLSKKDKKKAEKAALLAALEPEEIIPEVAAPIETTQTPEPAIEPVPEQSLASNEVSSRAATPPPEAQPELDEWAPKLSKKDKKKAEKAARLATVPTEDASPESMEAHVEEKDNTPEVQPEGTKSSFEEEPELDEWAPKKLKKGKEKAVRTFQVADFDATEPGTRTFDQPEQVNEPVEVEKSVVPEDSAATAQESKLDDDWAPKLSKKDKKKAEKAARLAALSIDEYPADVAGSAPPAAEDELLASVEEPTPSDPAQDFDDWAPKMSKKDKKKAEKAARLASMTDAPAANITEPSAIPVDDAPELAPEEPTVQQAQEPTEEPDEWAPKMSKKDKKKAEKAARLAALTQDEPTSSKDQPSEEASSPPEAPEPSPVAQEIQPDSDEWAPKKMSKKDKKKAEKLAKAAQLISDDVPQDPTKSDAIMEDANANLEASSRPATPAEAEPEFDDWAPKKKSKKDKKNAEKLARAAALSAGLAVAGGALSGSDHQADESEAHVQASQPEDNSESLPSQRDEASASEAFPATSFGPEPVPRVINNEMDIDQPPAEHDLDTAQVVPNPALDVSEPALYVTSQEGGLSGVEPQEGVGESWDETPITQTQEDATPLEVEPEDDEWALPVKKKGKKSKKNVAAPVIPVEEPAFTFQEDPAEQVSRDITMEPAEIASTGPEPEPAGDDMWTVPVKASKKSKKGKKKGSQEAAPSETPRAASPTRDELQPESVQATVITEAALEASEALPPVEDDPWEMPIKSGKKNKKGKKKASQEPTPAETSRAPSPSQVDVESAAVPLEPQDLPDEHTASTPIADDEWASSFSTQSSKKKKKKDRNAASMFTAGHEPSPGDRDFAEQLPPLADAAMKLEPESSTLDPEDNTDTASKTGTLVIPEIIPQEPLADPLVALQKPESTSFDIGSNTQNVALPESTTSRGPPIADMVAEPAQKDSYAALGDQPTSTDSIGKEEKAEVVSRDSDGSGLGTWGAGAAGAVAAGGVAAIAEKFGGGKKKKASKKKKILDKRQPREDDLFDDPALWESADKKGLDDVPVPQETEDFWNADDTGTNEVESSGDAGDHREDVQKQEQEPGQEKSKAALPTPSSVSPASESGWKETARQGARLDDEFEESPILGRGEKDPRRSTATGLLRLASDGSEPECGLLREDSQSRSLAGETLSDSPDFKRSPSRGLPVVQEVPETETETSRELWPSPEINRDSGFVTDSPNPLNRRSKTFEELREEPQRDSGIHTDEWDDAPPHTPGNRWEHKLRRSPQSTPRLREPVEQAATPEPEKRRTKNYGSLADEATPSRGISGPGAATAAALAAGAVAASTSPGRDPDPRSFSEGHARSLRDQGVSPSSSLTSQRAEPSLRRTASNTSIVRQRTPEPLKFRPESPGIRSTPTPPLRRVNRRISTELPPAPASRETNTPKPVANETKVRVRDKDKDMADVYDGFGEGRIGSPRSPTRPHSMRRRQSMQVLELESKVEQLLAENRLLSDARNHAEQNLSQRATSVLSERDAEIEKLKQSLQFLQNEVSRLTEVNEGLTSANAELASKDNSRYAGLEASSGDGSRGLDLAAGGAAGAAAGAAATVASYQQSIQEKDDEIADLRAQLEDAKERVREMQRQILASKAGEAEFLEILDEDHFDHRCQQLCSHVQQWVLRFSKFSDMRACRLTSEINDEKTIDRLDNAVLDGSDVDVYLKDRVRRRDIFMSMTMNMIWEFVFTRYLFGMDREQRQKLKSLEKLLTEVGPPQAVRQWRAVTLTLLSRRHSFKEQRDLDTEAVVQAIFQTLCKILPPPSNLEDQIQAQLRRVMAEAVALSIQMRTQKAEYMMLPPLQPEYDADGELAASVYFNASMMNERSGNSTVSNEELEAQQAKVRIVLFPLVVKKGDDAGNGDEEIVVCPAQVVVASRHTRRSMAPSSDAGGASLGGAPSRVSVVTEHMT